MQQFKALEYLMIDIANNFGLDKKDWDERLSWFENNEPKLERLVGEADSPALYMAGVKAFRAWQKDHNIENRYPISLDATSSGKTLNCPIFLA